ncbi:MAG TPA: TonB-dependent receptor [Terriglobales bacterium]|jgi:hypothetical protein|nr:TonB-dependent receptor [Terriglobales bacterium]
MMVGLKRGSLVCVLALASWLQAQTTGRMIGTITDQTGAAIVGAEVVVRSTATGERWTSQTGSAGIFSVPLLPSGEYKLTVSEPGFQQKIIENVTVNVTETTVIDVSLKVGDAQDSVTVVGTAALLETEGPQLGRVVDERGVSELPLATRNFTQILSLSPGTATYLPDATGLGRNTQAISVNGARVTQNNYQINGVDANGLGTNGPVLVPVPAPETIQEFKVQTSLYDATYGRAGGANIQMLTRSGSKEWHGSAYEYLRNEALNANDSFLKGAGVKRPVLRRNVFGATLGGPAQRDRAFFFISYQGAREANGASLINSISSNVLIAPGLTNDRSQTTLLATFHPVLPGGKPAAMIDPAALALLNAKLPNGTFVIPTPAADGRFTASSPSSFQEDQFNTNFDYDFGPKDTLWAKFFFSTISQVSALPSFKGTGPNVSGFGTDGLFNNRLIALQQMHAFSSSLINEVRLGYTLNRGNTFPREPVTDAQIGIARANAAQYPGLPLIRIAQPAGGLVIGTAAQALFLGAPATSTLNDTVSMVRGQHSMRTGVEIRYNLINFQNPALVRGQIDFLDFPSFLVGNARSATLGDGIVRGAWRAFDYNFFAQDDWRVSSRLTLNLGVRYELDLPVYDSRGRLSTFDPALYQPRIEASATGPVGPPVGGLIQAGNAVPEFAIANLPKGEDSLLRSVDPHNIAPRLGFAASLSKRLVMRGGYGLFYSRPTFQYASAAAALPPYYVLGIRPNAPLANPFLPIPPATQFPTFVPGIALAGTAFDRDQRVPYFHQFNLTTQYQFSENWLLETGYVGSRGRRLFRQVAINQAQLASPQSPIINVVTGTTITANTADNAQLRAPFQGVSENGFFINESDTESSYDSLQVSVIRRFARQLQLLGSYTWAKSIDDASGTGGGAGISGIVNTGAVGDSSNVLGDQLQRRANRGLSDFNRAHRLVVSYVWDLPALSFAQQSFAARQVFSNWRIAGILTVMSGLPVDIVDTGSGSLYGLASGSNPLARPSLNAGATCETAKENVPSGYFFNPFAFNSPVVLAGQPIPSSGGTAIAAARGTDIGNVPRNCIIGPSQSNLDFAVAKTFRLREERVVEFRTEFFNLFNHANFANPISNLNAVASSGGSIDPNTGRILQPGNFGRIISTSANPRLIQFALRVSF